MAPRTPTPPRSIDRAEREADLAQAAVDVLHVDGGGDVALERTAFQRLQKDVQGRLLSRLVQAAGGGDHPPRRDRLERAVERLCAPVDRGKSGKGQDFTLSECRLMLRQMPDSRRPWWIVRPEHGRRDGKSGAQALIPAAFFACGASLASHLE
jgi:tRNA(Ile)-lysidine synthase